MRIAMGLEQELSPVRSMVLEVRLHTQTGTAGYFSSSSGLGLIVEHGHVGIGTSNPIYLLDVKGGTIKSTGKSNGDSPCYNCHQF